MNRTNLIEMNAGNTLMAVYEPLPQWLNFLIMVSAIALVAFGVLIWAVKFRKKRQRKYRRRHRDGRGKPKANPTLADNGGLPPVRPTGKTHGP